MTAAEFKKKWSRYQGKETSGYVEHFNDLCRLLGHPTPVEADPSGNDFFCFQKGVIKDAELLGLDPADDDARPKKGFADVWKKDCFGWEYKGKHKNLDEAYKQLLRYRESLANPPLLVVCDFDRFIFKTNFNGTVQVTHEFSNAHIDDPKNLKLLRDVFTDPNYLRPLQTTAEITEQLAAKFAAVSRSLQGRESVELEDAFTRRELRVAQKKNLRIARFLNRVMFCFFAEDTGLLPKKLFSEIARIGLEDKQQFAESLEQLFRVMSKGGLFGHRKIRHFNGHLFEDVTVFELTDEEISLLADAAESDWQFIQPGIMGTLFERALDGEGNLRAQLGAHYTSEVDIKVLVEPVLMAPFRQEWEKLREEVREIHLSALRSPRKPGEKLHATATGFKRHNTDLQYNKLNRFVEKLAAVRVLDPACGSGNFLYVSLQLLLGLEKEVIAFGTEIDVAVAARVGVQQLLAIEINSYAFELAQVSVQIGYLQWRRDNGFDNDRTPVLQNLDGFQNEDALLVPHFRNKAKTLKQAQADEHAGDDALKFYTEREWPEADVIVGNPPFLGGSEIKEELGIQYQKELWRIYEERVPGSADLCCYWFEKARERIENGKCKRAGLLATQAIRGGANREVLKRIKETGDIFFAESDRPWILAGAAVNVSMVGFDNGSETSRTLDSKKVPSINVNLSTHVDITVACPLNTNSLRSFQGSQKIGAFDIPEAVVLPWLNLPNSHGRPNSDVLRPSWNGIDVTRRPGDGWIIDFGTEIPEAAAALYEKPFQYILERVKPERLTNNREMYRRYWWRHGEPRIAMRAAISPLERFIATSAHAKHPTFCWLPREILPDKALIVFALTDDCTFGILHSKLHSVWALKLGTQLEDRPRYTPTTCFETFPFPFTDDLQLPVAVAGKKSKPDSGWDEVMEKRFYTLKEEPPAYHAAGSSRREAHSSSPGKGQSLVASAATRDQHRAAIAAAAEELNALRERWLNPPEWTAEKILEFPGSVDSPWSRYVHKPNKDGIGTVRYPRLEPRDADCAAKLKDRTLTKLYNERPAWLDFAHKKLDAAVAAAYGWPADLSDEQILEKLLALNLARAAAETKAAKVKKPKTSREKQADELI